MSRTTRVVALHGFLGSPADWDALRPWLPDTDLVALDAWAIIESLAEATWDAVGAAIVGRLQAVRQDAPGTPLFLVAYSFGARLALAAAELSLPGSPVDGVALISANPGLREDDVAGRAVRRNADEAWARRFETLGPREIRTAWNAQPVLAGVGTAQPATAMESAMLPASRATLAAAMRAYSLAGQPDFRPRLKPWPPGWLWMWGSRDAKFAAIARELQAEGIRGAFVECPDAGHRVPWDNPEAFAALLRGWIEGHPAREAREETCDNR